MSRSNGSRSDVLKSFDRGHRRDEGRGFRDRRGDQEHVRKRDGVGRRGEVAEEVEDQEDAFGGADDDSRLGRTKLNGKNALSLTQVPYTTAASEFLHGKRAVQGALGGGKRKYYKLYLTRTSEVASEEQERSMQRFAQIAKGKGITVEWTSSSFIEFVIRKTQSFKGRAEPIHDGVMEVELAAQSKEDRETFGSNNIMPCNGSGWRKPLILWAHCVEDPQNLGALCRSALFFGVDAVAVTSRGSADFTSAAIRTGVGAPEYLQLLSVVDPVQFVERSRSNGWKFYAAVAPADKSQPTKLNELGPSPVHKDACVIVLGNEDEGLPEWISNKVDVPLTIPSGSEVPRKAGLDSLNVAAAGAIVCAKFSSELSPWEKTMLKQQKTESLF